MTTIHIIDGDAALRLVARQVLERAGFTVTASAGDWPVAPSCPELVVADLTVASLSAIQRYYPAARVLVMARAGVAPGDAALAGSLRKPFTPSQLLAAVRLCLARPCATTE
jgi:DNA-binding response OmpR family regulator